MPIWCIYVCPCVSCSAAVLYTCTLVRSRPDSNEGVKCETWSVGTNSKILGGPGQTRNTLEKKDPLSCPLLRLLLADIGFVYPVMSMVVIGPSLPILRQRRWSLLYYVYWLDLMMVIVNRWQVSYNGYFNGIEIPKHSSGSEIAQY